MKFGIVAVVISLTGMSMAQAAPVTYSEAVHGDLSAQNPAVLRVDAGVNTIDGVTGFGSIQQEAPNFSGDRDPFVLEVVAGMHIDKVSLTMLPSHGTVFGSEWLVVKDGNFASPVATFGQSFSGYTQSWLADFGPGSYLFHHGSMGGSLESEWAYHWDIEASSTAASVPEPASLALVLCSLGVLVGMRRLVGCRSGSSVGS